ncbi:cell envelope integrity protein TolA [Duganella sp. P38]|uniref:cell envelope integrity protein TolA n=1 Tax=Duganella sp. P38 TaxID=3423949 RepID=UPI003D7A7879
MHHDSHILSAHSDYCETCGQRLPGTQDSYATWERKSKNNRIGIGISIGLHVLGVLYYLFAPSHTPPMKPPAVKGGQMVYIAPLEKQASKPKPKPITKPETPKAKPKTQPSRKPAESKQAPVAPREKLETFVPPVQARMTPPPPEQDMSEMIAKRRAAREAQNPPAPPSPPVESEGDRAKRVAMANIARANNAATADESGGLFTVRKISFNSAEIKFRGFNTNFKRNWLKQVNVERGAEPDIETAAIKEMIKIIRSEKTGDFDFESRRLGRTVPLSARKEDEKQLFDFLMREVFPDYFNLGRR